MTDAPRKRRAVIADVTTDATTVATQQAAPAPAQVLDPLTLPLHGSRLIEASAGTGKTWTIAALYLRLVLGDTQADAATPARPLLPSEILVMTFTKAATRELSDRIRRRLVDAAARFREEHADDAGAPADDPFLQALLLRHPPGAERTAAAWRLATAAEAMDDAAVFTIDAWCQRMLREHAFDSGCLFDEELQANEGAMLAEAARDYWRQQVYPLTDDALQLALARWPTVDALVADARGLLDKPLPAGAGQGSLQQVIAGAAASRRQALAVLKAGWPAHCDTMQAWLDTQTAGKDGPFNKTKLKPATYTAWLDKLRAWALDPVADDTGLTDTARDRLTPTGLLVAVKPGMAIEPPGCFAAFATLMQATAQLPPTGPALAAHAAAHVTQRLQQLKAQTGSFGFADMLQRLHDALDEGRQGDSARRLRERIVAQYPVALIDEFQDTSPLQLAIFDRLYRIAGNEPARALLLIGDPKQSIYGFRGADIHSYLGARRATQGRHHVLGTNHRSTHALVGAVNHLFARAEDRPGAGAFLFASAGQAIAPGAQAELLFTPPPSELPFTPVAAKGRDAHLRTAAGPLPAVTLCLDVHLRSKHDSRAVFAAVCAERIVALLNDSAAGFASAHGALQRLRPGDVAVLVRTGTEAAAVRHALRRRGVASVYLSDKDSVFASAEAHDLLRLLQAVAAPRDVRLARAALATPLLGLSLQELLALASNDVLFDARCALLQTLHDAWLTQGVLAMLRRALHGFDLPARWLSAAGDVAGAELPKPQDGERRLTNVLHLAELLQTASAQLDGEQALIRWLAQQLADAEAGTGAADDTQVLRLESDADLVQVITVHKSKGLEYPVVYLPFAAHCRPVERHNTAAVWLPAALVDGAVPVPVPTAGNSTAAHGQRQLLLAPTDAQLAAADLERQREDLRLLYVALTRARHAVWVGLAALKAGRSSACDWSRSAIGYLLSGDADRTPDEMAADVQALVASQGQGTDMQLEHVALDPATDQPTALGQATQLLPRDALPPLLPALPYDAQFDRLWAVTSYSTLVRDLGRAPKAHGAMTLQASHDDPPARLLRDDEPADPDSGPERTLDSASVNVIPKPEPQTTGDADQPWHRFPRGAVAGNFLHNQLEWLADEGFALDDDPALQQALQHRCARQGWGHRADDVLAWLRRVCQARLPAVGASLSQLDLVLPEMEFWLPSDGLQAGVVDSLCRRHMLPGRPRPALPERQLRGMLMGFADLVFQHGGRYWVLDYKSNALGQDDDAYDGAAMDSAMLAHRYDVQAALYLLALHRLLRTRLGASYVPAQHLGGAVYVFLRGVAGSSAGCWHLPPPVALLQALEALLQHGAGGLP